MKKIFILSLLISVSAFGGEQVGTLTQLQGDVKIFSHPSKTLLANSPGPHALFENEYFQVSQAKAGDKVEKGNILRTTPSGKARIIYDNGDQVNIGPATALRITWKEDSNRTQTQVDLAYGKVRGIIEKGGPRSRLQVRTRTAVMGVRGTDFFIAQGGSNEDTEVSIIRGAVEVKPDSPKSKPVEVKAGFSVNVVAPPVKPFSSEKKEVVAAFSPKLELRKTTQEEFIGIQKTTVITPSTQKSDQKGTELSETEKKKLLILEQKATVTTLKDIKQHDKKLYAQLEKQGLKSIDAVNQAAIQTLLKDAPKAPEIRKPYKSEIESLDDGAYEKYFKNYN